MKAEQVRKMSAMDRLVYWVTEREKVRELKEAGLRRPWTDDVILDTYRFCNVRRMDDKVSRWLLDKWYTRYHDHPNILAACALARTFNQPASLARVERWVFRNGAGPLLGQVKTDIQGMRAQGCRVFNAAYVVSTNGVAMDKVEYVVDRVVGPLCARPPRLDTSSMERVVGELVKYNGFSTFMAGQVAADLRWAKSGEWRDRRRWAPLGPGSRRGLNRLYGFHPDASRRQSDTWTHEDETRGMLDETIHALYEALPPKVADRVEAMDLQNCLCEWDKYERALWGQGKPKQLYKPGRP